MKEILKKYKLNPKDWHYYGQWEQPTISAGFWVNFNKKEVVKKLDWNMPIGDIIMINGHTIVGKRSYEGLTNSLKQASLQEEDDFFENLNKVSQELFDEYGEIVKLSANVNLESFIKLKGYLESLVTVWYIGVLFTDHMGEIIMDESSKFDLDYDIVMKAIPQKESILLKEYRDALNIKEEIKNKGYFDSDKEKLFKKVKSDNKLWNKILEHVKEYDWVGTHHFWGQGLTVDSFVEQIISLEDKVEYEPHNFSQSIDFLIEKSADVTFIRQYSAEIFSKIVYKFRNFLSDIASQLSLDYDNLIYLTADEIVKYLSKGESPSLEDVEKRKKIFCVFLLNNKEVVLDNPKECQIIKDAFVVTSHKATDILKGVIGNKGIARGVAKVFLVPEDMGKMKAGDVLITPMTSPDFISLMKKASAIVTDVGGLLSHAAIISREMGKPCIIDTKIATKVFKDGDLVEVDADKGSVKKI